MDHTHRTKRVTPAPRRGLRGGRQHPADGQTATGRRPGGPSARRCHGERLRGRGRPPSLLLGPPPAGRRRPAGGRAGSPCRRRRTSPSRPGPAALTHRLATRTAVDKRGGARGVPGGQSSACPGALRVPVGLGPGPRPVTPTAPRSRRRYGLPVPSAHPTASARIVRRKASPRRRPAPCLVRFTPRCPRTRARGAQRRTAPSAPCTRGRRAPPRPPRARPARCGRR